MTRRRIDSKLFVYGTLKRAGVANHLLTSMGMKFAGEATTFGHLYSLGAYPVLIPSDGKGLVQGELFSIPRVKDEEILARLDQYEGSAYRRKTLTVDSFGGTLVVLAYVLNGHLPLRAKLIPSGRWDNHAEETSSSNHLPEADG
jgi:gamma-glutamylcyclotransferase (GGCT)/AIG2-like uncharacterized protein YtfP